MLKVPTETMVSLWRRAFTEQVRKARRHTITVLLAMVVKLLATHLACTELAVFTQLVAATGCGLEIKVPLSHINVAQETRSDRSGYHRTHIR